MDFEINTDKALSKDEDSETAALNSSEAIDLNTSSLSETQITVEELIELLNQAEDYDHQQEFPEQDLVPIREFVRIADASGHSPEAIQHALKGIQGKLTVKDLQNKLREKLESTAEADPKYLEQEAYLSEEIDQLIPELEERRDKNIKLGQTYIGTMIRISLDRSHFAQYKPVPPILRFFKKPNRPYLDSIISPSIDKLKKAAAALGLEIYFKSYLEYSGIINKEEIKIAEKGIDTYKIMLRIPWN